MSLSKHFGTTNNLLTSMLSSVIVDRLNLLTECPSITAKNTVTIINNLISTTCHYMNEKIKHTQVP